MSTPAYLLPFAVDRSTVTVTPDTPQPAGCRGDDRAARLVFQVQNTTASYHLELIDGHGAADVSTAQTPSAGQVVWDVPAAWTAPGIAAVRLVETTDDDRRLHYPPVRLLFADRPQADALQDTQPRWEQTMTEALQAAATATDAAAYANAMAAKANTAAESAAAVVAPTPDTALSDTSENVVQNKAVKAYVDAHIPNDWVIESGETTVNGTTWVYEKWNSGRLECRTPGAITITASFSESSVLGSVYRFMGSYVYLPEGFTAVHTTAIHMRSAGVWGELLPFLNSSGGSSRWVGTPYLYSPVTGSFTLSFAYSVSGRWK